MRCTPMRALGRIMVTVGLCLLCASSQAESPELRYREYLRAIHSATRLVDLNPYMSAAKRETLADDLKVVETRGSNLADIERKVLQFMRLGSTGEATYFVFAIDDEASLVLERAQSTTEVRMIRENGVWVVAEERLSMHPEQ